MKKTRGQKSRATVPLNARVFKLKLFSKYYSTRTVQKLRIVGESSLNNLDLSEDTILKGQ
jgi:hypothetical protein